MVKVKYRTYLYIVCLIFIWAIYLFPVLWLFLTSLKPEGEIYTASLPSYLTLEHYVKACSSSVYNIFKPLMNSLIITIMVVPLNLGLAILAGYGFSRFNMRGGTLLFLFFLVMRMLPPISIIFPVYLLFGRLNLLDTHIGISLLHSAIYLPVIVWIAKTFIDTIPIELEEIAMIDGCSKFGAFLRITLPLCKPILAVCGIFSFIWSWNELMIALTIAITSKAFTFPVAISTLIATHTIEWDILTACACLGLIPTILLSLGMQKYVIKGLTLGAIKE